MIADHTTTIVVDFDDTLAITHNRNWENAAPSQPLINQLNSLYDQGWTIHIVTARGQLSCGGDSAAADKKYRSQIESWCKSHGVKYHSLSFQKKLAAYYIDDKAILPDDFVSKFERIPLVGGLSNAVVYYDKATHSVYKTAKNSLSAVQWYAAAAAYGFITPHIHSLIGETIRMEYLPQYEGDIQDILNVCMRFCLKPAVYNATPKSYVDRCTSRLNAFDFSADEIASVTNILNAAMVYTPLTFSHGDVTLSNVMGCASDSLSPCLIDPICEKELYSSYVIDIAKLFMNCSLTAKTDECNHILKYGSVSKEILDAHTIGHLCRLYPYTSDKQTIKNLIKEKIKNYVF